MAKTEHSHPLGAVQSTLFCVGKRLKNGLKNGALPFTCCESGISDAEIARKTEHCRSLRKMQVAAINMLAAEKQSIAVHFFL